MTDAPDVDELVRRLIRETIDEEPGPQPGELAEADQVRAFVVELADRFKLDLGDATTLRALVLGVLSPGLWLTARGADDALEDGLEERVVDALALVGFVVMSIYEEAGRHG